MPHAEPEAALYIDPPTHHFLGDRLFDSSVVPTGGDDILAPYKHLRSRCEAAGVPVFTADRLDSAPVGRRKAYVSMGRLEDYARFARRPDVVASAFFAMECPIVEPSLFRALPRAARIFKRVLSWTDTRSLLPFTGRPVAVERFRWPQCFDDVHTAAWERGDRGFLVMINANKLPRLYRQELYTARLRAVEYFGRFGEIDLYGKNWGEIPHRVGRIPVPWTLRRMHRALLKAWDRVRPNPLYAAATKAARGAVASKADTLSRYRFALCFENMILPGWITEKIFDCFYAGTVPVYWGAPDVETAIPPDCYVDMRRFKDFAELRAFLRATTDAEVAAYRAAARRFLASDAYAPFKKAAFADLFARFLKEDVGVVV